MTAIDVSASAAFFAGLLSFFSPCILPLVPSYLSYITGSVFGDSEAISDISRIRKRTAGLSILFIFGFSAVFIAMGAAAGFLGSLLIEYRRQISVAGGLLIIVFGLNMAGALKIRALNSYFRFGMNNNSTGYLRAVLTGIIFAAGWTPCIGPMLGSILVLASTSGSVAQGVFLLSLYSLGMAAPFLIISLSANHFIGRLKSINRWVPAINMFSGAVLITAGILLVTGMFERLAYIFY